MKIYVNAQRIEYANLKIRFYVVPKKAQINRAHIRLSGWNKNKNYIQQRI